MDNKKIRIYAKIIGYVLPKNDFILNHCVIKKMSFKEQKKRKFLPLRNVINEDFKNPWYKSYITYPSNSDFREIKSNYVIFTDIERFTAKSGQAKDSAGYHGDISSALGIAIRRFDKVIGALSLSSCDLLFNKHKRYLATKYDYQVCRIYELVGEKEIDAEKPFMGGWGGMINFPDKKSSFKDINFGLMNRMLESKDKVFVKSLRYLLKAVKGMHLNLPIEKIFIDYTKSIELIINSFKGKYFSKKLERASKILDISDVDRQTIKDIWKSRSRGDFAHASDSLRSFSLPPQFPEPSDADFFAKIDSFELCSMILLKYFKYIDNEVEVRINDSSKRFMDDKYFDKLIDVNIGEYLAFYTSIKNRRTLTIKLKQELAKHYKCKYKNIKLRSFKQDRIVFKIISS